MANTTLTHEVETILSAVKFDGLTVKLPAQITDRKIYEQVNKALTNAGGKWNKKAGGHVFDTDPQPKIEAMLATGVAVDEKKLYQAFDTPLGLAAKVAAMAYVSGCEVLEPSAGLGSLALAVKEAGGFVSCVEIQPARARKLEELGFSPVYCGDFMSMVVPEEPYFDRVVMNPPFNRGQDIDHVRHAIKFIVPGGKLVALVYPDLDRKGMQEILSEHSHSTEDVEEGAFAEAGTKIKTVIIRLAIE